MSDADLAATLLIRDFANRRRKLGASLGEISKRTEIPIQYLSKVENDEIKKPNHERLKKIDQALSDLEREPKEVPSTESESIAPSAEDHPKFPETHESPKEPEKRDIPSQSFKDQSLATQGGGQGPAIGGDHVLDELKPYIDAIAYLKEKFEGRTPLQHRVIPITSPENIQTMTRLNQPEMIMITDFIWASRRFGKRWKGIDDWVIEYMETKKSEEGKGIEEAIRFTAAISESRIFKWLVSQGEKIKREGEGLFARDKKP